MLAGMRRGLAADVAIVTKGLTSPAASLGSCSTWNPSCRSRVPRAYLDATKTQGELSPAELPHCPDALQPRSASAPGSPRGWHPPAHARSPQWPWRSSAEDGRGRVTVVPARRLLPCGSQMGAAVPGVPAGAGSQRSPHGAGSARSPLALVCEAPIKDGSRFQSWRGKAEGSARAKSGTVLLPAPLRRAGGCHGHSPALAHAHPAAGGAASRELHLPQREPRPRLCHRGRPVRVHGGATTTPAKPPREQPPAVPVPEGCPCSGQTRSRAGRRREVPKLVLPLAPAHEPPCQHKHGAWLAWRGPS